VEFATAGDVARAVSRARDAQLRWFKLPFSDRLKIVRRFHDRVLSQRDRILDTIQSETGKSRRDALTEVIAVAGTARYYLQNSARHLESQRRQSAVPAITSAEVIFKPHGVVGLITAWNYPFLLGIGDAIPALIAGNGVVVKGSELTPLSVDLARDLFVESGIDPDLLANVHGGGDVGNELIQHVDYVGFTGGTETGRKVAVAASSRLIPFSLELGGKNPMIVLEGASLDNVVNGILVGAFANSGQSCISIERAYIQESIYEEFARRLVQKTSQLKLGWSPSWDINIGSMISVAHAENVRRRIEQAVNAGVRVLAGGGYPRELGPAFVEPTILSGASDDMPISRQETFGPVIALYPVRSVEEAIRRANDSSFGLNASVWAGDRSQARAVARQLDTGSAAINSTLLIYSTFDVPMGGVKQSGIGHRHGEHGILRYTQVESIVSSIARGGGHDSLLLRIKNERMANILTAVMKLWRRVG
jgi:succinate-semialdehyde dehydrogenase/glutarate-semialdehyde dehydrogenase